MKKITILLIAIFVTSLGFAQINSANHYAVKKATKGTDQERNSFIKKQKTNNSAKVDVIYDETFESESPEYTIVNHSTSSAAPTPYQWNVNDRAGFWVTEADFCDGRWTTEDDFWMFSTENTGGGPYTPDRGKMAYILGEYTITDPAWYPTHVNGNVNSSLILPALDFSSVTNPTISFYSLFRLLNQTYMILEWSDDNWTTVNLVDTLASGHGHNGYSSNTYYETEFTYVVSEVSGKSNVQFRFHYDQPAQTSTPYGYVWFLDDIYVIETPAYEIALGASGTKIGWFTNDVARTDEMLYWDKETGIEFYSGVDAELEITEPGNYFRTSSNNYGWHHRFGNIPRSYQNDNLSVNFQAQVISRSAFPAKVKLTISVMPWPNNVEYINELDPATAVFSKSAVSRLLQPGEMDTVSVYGENAFLFTGLQKGDYAIRYELSPLSEAGDPQTDDNETNNVHFERFRITDDIASISTTIGTEIDGETANYSQLNTLGYINPMEYHLVPMTFFHNVEVDKVSVLISRLSGIGSTMTFTVLKQYVDEEEMAIAEATITEEILDVTEENLGQWFNIEFPAEPIETIERAFLTRYDNEEAYQKYNRMFLKIEYTAVDANDAETRPGIASQQLTYEEGCNLGEYAPASPTWTWFHDKNSIPIVHFHLAGIEVSADAIETSFNVYPNPANEEITITNSENKNIQIVNIYGQVVKTIVASSELQTINVSDLANGMYFVQIENEVVKINIIK